MAMTRRERARGREGEKGGSEGKCEREGKENRLNIHTTRAQEGPSEAELIRCKN